MTEVGVYTDQGFGQLSGLGGSPIPDEQEPSIRLSSVWEKRAF